MAVIRIVPNGVVLTIQATTSTTPTGGRRHSERRSPPRSATRITANAIFSSTRHYGHAIDPLPDLGPFVAAFGEWVEACWFAEHDGAPARLEALLAFPPDVVLVGSLEMLRRLLELSDPRGVAPAFGDVGDVGGALAQHLLITGPDPAREALIRAVVSGVAAPPSARRELLVTYGSDAVTVAALECSSVLTQALANRWGVVPSNILEDL